MLHSTQFRNLCGMCLAGQGTTARAVARKVRLAIASTLQGRTTGRDSDHTSHNGFNRVCDQRRLSSCFWSAEWQMT